MKYFFIVRSKMMTRNMKRQHIEMTEEESAQKHQKNEKDFYKELYENSFPIIKHLKDNNDKDKQYIKTLENEIKTLENEIKRLNDEEFEYFMSEVIIFKELNEVKEDNNILKEENNRLNEENIRLKDNITTNDIKNFTNDCVNGYK